LPVPIFALVLNWKKRKCAPTWAGAKLISVLIETRFYKTLHIDIYRILPEDDKNDLKTVKDWRDMQKPGTSGRSDLPAEIGLMLHDHFQETEKISGFDYKAM